MQQMGTIYFVTNKTRPFFANVVSHRDNGARIELNLRGTHYQDAGRYSGRFEDCYPSESETNITQCDVIQERAGTNKVWCLTVDFYEFSESEQERFLEAAAQEWEFEN